MPAPVPTEDGSGRHIPHSAIQNPHLDGPAFYGCGPILNAPKHAPHERPSQYLTRKIPSAKLLLELIERIPHKSVIAESVMYCMKGANCGKGYRDCGACWRDHHP